MFHSYKCKYFVLLSKGVDTLIICLHCTPTERVIERPVLGGVAKAALYSG